MSTVNISWSFSKKPTSYQQTRKFYYCLTCTKCTYLTCNSWSTWRHTTLKYAVFHHTVPMSCNHWMMFRLRDSKVNIKRNCLLWTKSFVETEWQRTNSSGSLYLHIVKEWQLRLSGKGSRTLGYTLSTLEQRNWRIFKQAKYLIDVSVC